MNAAITDGQGRVALQDIPMPEPGPYQCLCRIEACATCTGTDRRLIEGTMSWGKYPGILGHESVGAVIACGAKVRRLKVGDRLLRPVAAYPGTRLGGFESILGGLAEFGLVTDTATAREDDPSAAIPAFCVYQQPLPPDLPIEAPDATLLVTLKELASFVRDLGMPFGARVAILGSGPVAMAMCFFAKLRGARPVIAVGRRPEPLAACRAAGADAVLLTGDGPLADRLRALSGGAGVEFLLDAAGDNALILESARALVRRGVIATYAVRHGPLEIEKLGGLWTLVRGAPDESSTHAYLLDLARLGVVPFRRFYSHVLPFAECARGFELLRRREASKIVFTMAS